MNDSLLNKVWLSWSSGKDSYAALRSLKADGRYDVECSFTVFDPVTNRIPMHAVSIELMVQQLMALGLRHRLVPLDDKEHTGGISNLIDNAHEHDVCFFAFGDLFLEDIRNSREQNMLGTNIGTLFPLWQKPTNGLLLDLINDGMRAIIISVDLAVLPTSFLGRELTVELVEELVRRGCDPCGENGEYHSFVFDGPLFKHPVDFQREEPSVGEGFAHLPLAPTNFTSSIESPRRNISKQGYAVITPSAELRTSISKVSTDFVSLVNTFCKWHADGRDFSDLDRLRQGMAAGLSGNDAAIPAIIEYVLQTMHELIPELQQEMVPALAKLARVLGFDASPDQAIARFRIASNTQSQYDHLWHQDSIDPPGASRGQRASNLGFWIPLHDVNIDEGALEVSLGSHFRPIPHTETDPFGRLYFPEEWVQAYKKRVIPVSYGSILALDSWLAHRSVSNTCGKVRIALLIWFSSV